LDNHQHCHGFWPLKNIDYGNMREAKAMYPTITIQFNSLDHTDEASNW
jgi:hypothetical protein